MLLPTHLHYQEMTQVFPECACITSWNCRHDGSDAPHCLEVTVGEAMLIHHVQVPSGVQRAVVNITQKWSELAWFGHIFWLWAWFGGFPSLHPSLINTNDKRMEERHTIIIEMLATCGKGGENLANSNTVPISLFSFIVHLPCKPQGRLEF